MDARDPTALGDWWRQALGWVVVNDDPDEFEIRPAADRLPGLLFVPVPEPKTTKNRLHLDFRPDDQAAEVARFEHLGARRVDVGQGDESWVVLATRKGTSFACCRRAARRARGRPRRRSADRPPGGPHPLALHVGGAGPHADRRRPAHRRGSRRRGSNSSRPHSTRHTVAGATRASRAILGTDQPPPAAGRHAAAQGRCSPSTACPPASTLCAASSCPRSGDER